MIICDSCKKKTYNEDTIIYRGYFYPREIMVEKPLVFDMCEDCMYELFKKKAKAKMESEIEEMESIKTQAQTESELDDVESKLDETESKKRGGQNGNA